MSKRKFVYDPDTLSYKQIEISKNKLSYYIITFLSIIVLLINVIAKWNNSKLNTNPEINDEIEKLEKITKELDYLKNFIIKQKLALQEKGKVLQELEAKKEKLKNENDDITKILNLNKEKIELILEYQNKEQRKEKYKDYIIGFILGIIASLVGGIILRNFNRTPKNEKEQ